MRTKGFSLFFLTCGLIVKCRRAHIKIYYRKVIKVFSEGIARCYRSRDRKGVDPRSLAVAARFFLPYSPLATFVPLAETESLDFPTA